MVAGGGIWLVAMLGLWLLSPGFLWQMLPDEAEFKAVLASDRRIVELVPDLVSVEPYLAWSQTIGVAQEGQQRLLIIRPTWAGYGALPQKLQAAGYTTQWYGWWLMARTEGTMLTPQPLSRVLVAAWRVTEPEMNIYNPLFIGQGKRPGTEEPVRVIGVAVGKEWRVWLSQLTDERWRPLRNVPPAAVDPAEADITVSGTTLAALPPRWQNQWNEWLWGRFGFTKTQPDFVGVLKQYETVQFWMTKEGARVGVRPWSEQWEAKVSSWVEEEERYSRIERRLFRLPDGTWGAEFVPGPRRTVFKKSDRQEDCQEARVQATTVWLCRGGAISYLMSNESLRKTPDGQGEVFRLGRNYLPLIDGWSMRALTGATDGAQQMLLRWLWD